MKKDKKRVKLQQTLTSIDMVLAALNSYPNLEDAILDRVQGEANKFLGQFFPTQLDFSKEILEHLVGTDVLIEIVSDFITFELPAVEIALKSALLVNMNNLGTNCTIDPFIYEKAIKEGIVFDLKQIDLIDKLSISPLDRKIGQYYYFGIEGCESAYDVLQSAIDPNSQPQDNKQSTTQQKEDTSYLNRVNTNSVGTYFGERKRDFDCLLWYMKNKAAYREVWGKRTSESEDIFNGDSNIPGWIEKRGSEKTCYYEIKDGTINFYLKSGSKITPPKEGSLIAMVEGETYVFLEGTTYYEYKFGLPPIKKLSRSRYYINRKSDDNCEIYFFNDGKWNKNNIDGKTKYETFEDIPVTAQKDDCYCIDNSFYVITSDPTKKEKKAKDKDGKEYTYTYISADFKECIDITNDIKNNTCIFVDYDLGNNRQNIKEGKDVESTFLGFCPGNKGQGQWYKEESDKTAESISPGSCYYVKKSKDGFDINVDKILIPPHFITDDKNGIKNANYCVSITKAMAKKNKYTKDFGIVTLEFSPRTGNVLQSDGKPMQQQTPYDNVLHVFFGNVKELHTTERDRLQENWKNSSDVNKIGMQAYNKMMKIQKNHADIWKRKLKEWKKTGNPSGDKIEVAKGIVRENDEFRKASQDYYTLTFGNDIQILPNLIRKSSVYNDIEGIRDKLNQINGLIDKYYNDVVNTEVTTTSGDDVYVNFVKPEFDFMKFQEFETKLIELLTEKNEDEKNIFSIYAYVQRASQIMDANENLLYLSAKDLEYPEAKKNYYLKRTLFEFNEDYINSLQLFDSKVLAAQLITSLFGGVVMEPFIGATLSWKSELIRETVKDMIEKIIAVEDFTVNDCFFTFTNDAYNGMLRATELRQAGLYSSHGEENGNNSVNPIKLLEGLNGIDETADKSSQKSTIEGTLKTVAAEVSKDIYKENAYLAVNTNFGVEVSFIDNLITNLCTQLTMAMLSPKVYLLILINLEMFGLTTNFTLRSFLENFSNLIRSLVKSIVDQVMQYLSEKIMEIVEDLVQKLKIKIEFEQAEMYMRLLKQIWMHLRMFRGRGSANMGWTQDTVTFADITNSDSQEPVNEC